MNLDQTLRLIRILTWIAFITLAGLSINYKYDSCNVCKLEYKEQTLDGGQFMQIYQSECLQDKSQDTWQTYSGNFSQINLKN